jgi:cellulose synthase/poly-beta-1,6-N-acetylglucosamine synthase-like glycosyltransferase
MKKNQKVIASIFTKVNEELLKNFFYALVFSWISCMIMMVLSKDTQVFIPSLFIILPLILYVTGWIIWFISFIKKGDSLILVVIFLSLLIAAQTISGHVLLDSSLSYIVTLDKIENNGSKEYLKLVELKDYKKHLRDGGKRLVLEYQGNQVETFVSFEFYSKVDKEKCKAIEMTVYKGNLGLYYIIDSKREAKICAE